MAQALYLLNFAPLTRGTSVMPADFHVRIAVTYVTAVFIDAHPMLTTHRTSWDQRAVGMPWHTLSREEALWWRTVTLDPRNRWTVARRHRPDQPAFLVRTAVNVL